jgi:biotin carboxylase
MKKVLLLCAGHNDLGLIRGLKKLGYYIVATGNNEYAVGNKLVDKWINADYSNQELILDIARKENVDNICACCNDFGVYTAACVAEKLDLPGYDSYETTLILHNKDKFKEFTKKYNITSPIAEGFDNKDVAKETVRRMELPVIVKPVDCSAGNGISVITDYSEANNCIEKAFSKSRSARIVIEPFIKGSQHGFCTFLVNRKVVAYASNDEFSIINPYRVEIDTFPATDWEICAKPLIEQIEKMADILKLKDGIFHLQYILMDGEPWILEVMRRTVGNMYHVLSNPLNGIDWEYWEAKARCGLDCSDFPRPIKQEGYFAYKALLANQNGEIESIHIPEEYKKYVFDEFYLRKVGDTITHYESEPIGFLFMMFKSAEEMKSTLVENYRNDLIIVRK